MEYLDKEFDEMLNKSGIEVIKPSDESDYVKAIKIEISRRIKQVEKANQ